MKTLYCGYEIDNKRPVVMWNEFNGVVQCHNCGEQYQPKGDTRMNCHHCGTKLTGNGTALNCPSCESMNPPTPTQPTDTQCPDCGSPLRDSLTVKPLATVNDGANPSPASNSQPADDRLDKIAEDCDFNICSQSAKAGRIRIIKQAILEYAAPIVRERDELKERLQTNIEIRKSIDCALIKCSQERDTLRAELALLRDCRDHMHTELAKLPSLICSVL